MSGKFVTFVVLAICGTLVAYAVFQRSRDTSRIRAFWTGNGANTIQHATTVWFAPANAYALGQLELRDVSEAPGLVHLRATLVEDRYFDWTTTRSLASGTWPNSFLVGNNLATENWILLRFERGHAQAEMLLEVAQGIVYSNATRKSAQLIPASQAAVQAYVETW